MSKVQQGSTGISREATWFGLAIVTVAYVLVLRFTSPIHWGDTPVYADHIIGYSKGTLPPTLFWEFGHLLWRPLGYLMWLVLPQSETNQRLQLYLALQAPSVALGLMGVWCTFLVCRQIARNIAASLIASLLLIGSNPFLNYVQTGSAYIPGYSLMMLGLWLILGYARNESDFGHWRVLCGGVALALGVCLWLPYLFALPGVFLLIYLWAPDQSSSRRWRRLYHVVAVTAVTGTGIYGLATMAAGVGSLAELKAWIDNAGHGVMIQRGYLRAATGLPRSLFELGDDGINLKRFVLRDPYAPISLKTLLATSYWRLILYYLGMGGLAWAVYRDRKLRPFWLALVASFASMGFFVVVLFEASSPERWLPCFPVLMAAIAGALSSEVKWNRSLIAFAALFIAVGANNLPAYANTTATSQLALKRLESAIPQFEKNDLMALLSYRDGISDFRARFPFHPISRQIRRIFYVTEPGNASSMRWQRQFADFALEQWKAGGNVWLSKRLFARRPQPEWKWVEFDDQYLRWEDVPAYFGQLKSDRDIAGDDGFLRLAHTPENEAILRETPEKNPRAVASAAAR